jgi:hypothetical protein
LLDEGALIPLDQIIAGPRRARIEFEKDQSHNEVRPFSDLLNHSALPVTAPLRTGGYASKSKGWGSLAPGAEVAYQVHPTGPDQRRLQIGRVLANHRDEKFVVVQPMLASWTGMHIVHKLQYQTPHGYSSVVGPIEAKERIRYEALVAQVERLTGGELNHGSARRLSDRGWGLLLKELERGRNDETLDG